MIMSGPYPAGCGSVSFVRSRRFRLRISVRDLGVWYIVCGGGVCINPLIHFHYGYRKQVSEEYRPPESGKEIATTLQYLYFHVHFEDDGYEYFSKMMKQTSITEMFHTDKIADRILFLQGEVEMMPSFEPRKIRDVKEALEFSMTLEQRTVDSYNEWARLCAAEDDQITHKLFQDLAKEEEEHLDMFRTEMENMLNYGEQYLALQSIAHSKEITKK